MPSPASPNNPQRVALYLQDKHPIRYGMEYAQYAESRGFLKRRGGQ